MFLIAALPALLGQLPNLWLGYALCCAGATNSWEVRQRVFLILALVHAFFLRFLAPDFAALRDYLLNAWCHRNGERSRLVQAPLYFYRLRFALAFFWLRFPPPLLARLSRDGSCLFFTRRYLQSKLSIIFRCMCTFYSFNKNYLW